MPPKTPPERIGTPFEDGDGLDLHRANPEFMTLSDLEQAAYMSYEATPDARTGRVDGAAIVSLAGRRLPEAEAEPELSPLERTQVNSRNLRALRTHMMSGENQPSDATIIPFPHSKAASSPATSPARDTFSVSQDIDRAA